MVHTDHFFSNTEHTNPSTTPKHFRSYRIGQRHFLFLYSLDGASLYCFQCSKILLQPWSCPRTRFVFSLALQTPTPPRLEVSTRAWLGKLLSERGVDIFRMKGFISLAGEPNRFVFQGVHMLFDGQPNKPWGDETRHNQLVFIGRNLDEQEMREGFEACLM